jgi:hypothetical protein
VERLQREKDASEVDAARMQRDLSVAAAKRRSFSSKLAQVERLDAARDRTLSMIHSARSLNPSVSFALPQRVASAIGTPPEGAGSRAMSPTLWMPGNAPGQLALSRSMSVAPPRGGVSEADGSEPVRYLRPFQSMAGPREVPGSMSGRTST